MYRKYTFYITCWKISKTLHVRHIYHTIQTITFRKKNVSNWRKERTGDNIDRFTFFHRNLDWPRWKLSFEELISSINEPQLKWENRYQLERKMKDSFKACSDKPIKILNAILDTLQYWSYQSSCPSLFSPTPSYFHFSRQNAKSPPRVFLSSVVAIIKCSMASDGWSPHAQPIRRDDSINETGRTVL